MNVHIETEILAPARLVWRILAHEFGEVAAWSSTVTASHSLTVDDLPDDAEVDPRAPVAARQTTSAFVTAREYFLTFDDASMTFTFAALDLPFFLMSAENTSRVTAIDADRCRVIFDVQMHLWGPFAVGSGLMRTRFTRAMNAVHRDLKVEAEARAMRARGAADATTARRRPSLARCSPRTASRRGLTARTWFWTR